jgi:predicted O-methyltransferase YrrM
MDMVRALRRGKGTFGYLFRLASHSERLKAIASKIKRVIESYDEAVTRPSHLPEGPLHEVLHGVEQLPICLSHKLEAKGLPYGEAYVLAAIARHVAPRTVFEIGTFRGASTLLMAQQAGAACRLYTLDMPPGRSELALAGLEEDPPDAQSNRIGERFRGTPEEQQITQLYGDSASFDFSPYAGRIDLVFVDGSHSYDYVRNDTHWALEMLSPQGTIVWDDCARNNPDVIRALDAYGASMPISRINGTRFALYTRCPIAPRDRVTGLSRTTLTV